MTPEERLSRTEANIDRLAIVVNTLAGSVMAHNNRIATLLTSTEEQVAQLARLHAAIEQ